MEKSNLTVLLILLVGILTFISCSSGDDSPNNSSSSGSGGGGDKIISCLWEDSEGKVCAKFYAYGYSGNTDCNRNNDGGRSVESCPNNPDKTCLMVSNMEGKEYDVDLFIYGYKSSISYSCERWSDMIGGWARPR